GKVNELSLGAVMTMEGSDKRIAETIVTTSGSEKVKVLTMDSMQSVTENDIEAGAAYLSIMEDNLKIMEEALR
ncbi:MAG: zinc ABC transporter substrate-binding protein, partial [Eubacterium sp.]|nr:zinc ABC transporter substrate-binding protein [Eubacterium sp.]